MGSMLLNETREHRPSQRPQLKNAKEARYQPYTQRINHGIYRPSCINGTVFFEDVSKRPPKKEDTLIEDDYPDISTILSHLVQQLTQPYPQHWYGRPMQQKDKNPDDDRPENDEDHQKESFVEKELINWVVPLHPFIFTGDTRPRLYSVHQFDVRSSSVSLLEWPKVLVTATAVLNGPSAEDYRKVYPEGLTIKAQRHQHESNKEISANHAKLVFNVFPQGFLVRIPPNSIVLSRGCHEESAFVVLVHKPIEQNHKLRLDGSSCDFKASKAQIELCERFSPYHLAQHMFPDGLLVKVAFETLLQDETTVVVSPNDVHAPQDFTGGREGIVAQESIEDLDVLLKLCPVGLAKEFFPNGLVLRLDKHAFGEFVTPIFNGIYL